MTFARLLVLTSALAVLPVVASAQAATQTTTQSTAQAATPVQAARTQDVTVVEPNTDALKPPQRPAMTAPKWSEFPKAPKAVPTVPDFAGRVHKEEGDSAQLEAIGRRIVWEKFEPTAITADVAARLDPSKMTPIDPELTPAQTEALAQSLRAQAAPPPVAQ